MQTGHFNTIMAQAAELFNGSFDSQKTIKIGNTSFEVFTKKNGLFVINKNKKQLQNNVAEADLANTLFEVLQTAEAPAPKTETVEYDSDDIMKRLGFADPFEEPETPAETPATEQTEQPETPADVPTEQTEQTEAPAQTEQPETPADVPTEQTEQTEAPATEQTEQPETPATDPNTDLLKEILGITKAQAAKLDELETKVSKIRNKSFEDNFAEMTARNKQINELKLEIHGLNESLRTVAEALSNITALNNTNEVCILVCPNGSDDDESNFIEIASNEIVKNALESSILLLKKQITDREAKIAELSQII